MKIPHSLLFAVLLALTLSACTNSRKSQPPPEPIGSCGTEALEYCEAPKSECRDDPSMACTDPEDSENRARWALCRRRHAAAVDCLRIIEAAGLMRRPQGEP